MSSPCLTSDALAAVFHESAAGLSGAVRAVAGARVEAGEVLQEAFLKAWRALRSGHRPRDVKAWVFTVTINHARDTRRRVERHPSPVPLATGDDAMTQTGPLTHLQRIEARQATERAIETLPEAEKDVFLLRVSGELTFAAAAEALGIPEGTAKTRMRSALSHLRARLLAFAPDRGSDARRKDA